jgi:hypothetical protein
MAVTVNCSLTITDHIIEGEDDRWRVPPERLGRRRRPVAPEDAAVEIAIV